MAKQPFGALIGNLQKKVAFIGEHRSVLARFKDLDPTALLAEISKIAAIDATQESLKGEKKEKTAGVRDALAKTLNAAGALVDELKAAVKRSGRTALLAALPRFNLKDTFDATVGKLRSLLAFVQENPDAAKKVDRSELNAVKSGIDAAVEAQSKAGASRRELPATTRTLKETIRQATGRVAAWLDVLQGAYTLLGDDARAAEVRGIRSEGRPKSRPRRAKTPADTATPQG